MDIDLLYDLIEGQTETWEHAATSGPGCGVDGHDDACLCDVVIPDQPTTHIIPPYQRSGALRELLFSGTRLGMLDWMAAVAVITDLTAMARDYDDEVQALRIAFALPTSNHGARVNAMNAALRGLFARGLTLEQAIALSGIAPVDLVGALAPMTVGNVDAADRLLAADRMLRTRKCPSVAWVARQTGVNKRTLQAYAARWDLDVEHPRSERQTPHQIRSYIERLATTTTLKSGAIARAVATNFPSSPQPKYMALAQTVSRARRAGLAVAV